MNEQEMGAIMEAYGKYSEDLDEAFAWAAKIPSAADGSIEVRPIIEFGDHDH
jgi:hypothetical protein